MIPISLNPNTVYKRGYLFDWVNEILFVHYLKNLLDYLYAEIVSLVNPDLCSDPITDYLNKIYLTTYISDGGSLKTYCKFV